MRRGLERIVGAREQGGMEYKGIRVTLREAGELINTPIDDS